MSYLLETDSHFVSELVMTLPKKHIVTPKYRSLMRQSNWLDNAARKELFREEVMMKKVCEKLTENELEKLQMENDQILERKFMKMKHRMKRSVEKESSLRATEKNSEVIKYLNNQVKSPSLSTLAKSDTQKIEIGIKYQNKLAIRLSGIKETEEIENSKKMYRSWFDEENNCFLKSPNFTQVDYYFIQMIEKFKINRPSTGVPPADMLQLDNKKKGLRKSFCPKNLPVEILAKKAKHLRASSLHSNPALTNIFHLNSYSPKSRIENLIFRRKI